MRITDVSQFRIGNRLPSGAVCVVEHKAYPVFELNGNRWEMCQDDLDVFFGGSVDVTRDEPKLEPVEVVLSAGTTGGRHTITRQLGQAYNGTKGTFYPKGSEPKGNVPAEVRVAAENWKHNTVGCTCSACVCADYILAQGKPKALAEIVEAVQFWLQTINEPLCANRMAKFIAENFDCGGLS